MINYMLINIMLTSGALLINSLMNIPHRIRFFILITALIGWLIPFGLMSIELSGPALPIISTENFLTTSQQVMSRTVIQNSFNWQLIISLLVMAGFIRFGIDLIGTVKLVKNLSKESKPCNKNQQIRYVENIHGAFVSGYFKPIIWIDERHKNSRELNSIITHELQHISSHDQFWLLLITLIQRLFWFNPLVYILSHKTRQSIELSCDEACKQLIGQSEYQSHLAELIISKQQTTYALLSNQIHADESFNVHRVKQLNQEYTMNLKQKVKLSTTVTLISMLCLYSLLTFADDNPMPGLKAGQVYIELRITEGTQAPKELSLIVSSQDLAAVKYDSYHLSIKPTIINTAKESTENEHIQIMNELIFSKVNSDTTQTVLTSPSLLVLNKNWASIKVNDDTNDEQIHIELKPTVKNWLNTPSTAIAPAPVPTSPAIVTTAPVPPAVQIHNSPPQPAVPASPPQPEQAPAKLQTQN